MACGTHVIAWNDGAVPEVIDEGVTGFVVLDVDAVVTAVAQHASLDRAQIRDVFDRRFNGRPHGPRLCGDLPSRAQARRDGTCFSQPRPDLKVQHRTYRHSCSCSDACFGRQPSF
jgi:glycosyltransferase involved in cell wall biosynthesis